MKRQLFLATIALAVFISACSTNRGDKTVNDTGSAKKIVSVGGSATEIVYALGEGANVVGVDTSSVYPEEATKLPQVGYQRQLSAEGVISLKPSIVIMLPEAGPPAAIKQIEDAGIKVLKLNNESTAEGTRIQIRQVGEALDRKDKAEEIIAKLNTELAEAEKLVAESKNKPSVIFIYSRGTGAAQVGGTGTPAEAIIKMAGGENAVTEFSDYKTLTPEALISAKPDFILLPSRAVASLGGIDGILAMPGVKDTPAGQNKRIIAIDDMLLLGFTPRLGEGVKELHEKLKQ